MTNEFKISRSGIFELLQEDKTIKEFRPIEELIKCGSKFHGIPILNETINPVVQGSEEMIKNTIGFVVSAEIDSEGNVFADLIVKEEALLQEVRSGKKMFKCCYAVTPEQTKGVFEGEEYERIQRELYPLYVFVESSPEN